jgi:hypothetical protein
MISNKNGMVKDTAKGKSAQPIAWGKTGLPSRQVRIWISLDYVRSGAAQDYQHSF